MPTSGYTTSVFHSVGLYAHFPRSYLRRLAPLGIGVYGVGDNVGVFGRGGDIGGYFDSTSGGYALTTSSGPVGIGTTGLKGRLDVAASHYFDFLSSQSRSSTNFSSAMILSSSPPPFKNLKISALISRPLSVCGTRAHNLLKV